MSKEKIDKACREFIQAVKETEAYRKYHDYLEKLKEDPECYRKVNEYRQRNYEIQNTVPADRLFDEMDAFEKEYEELRENPLVDGFLQAELAFCRMLQDATLYITQELNFE